MNRARSAVLLLIPAALCALAPGETDAKLANTIRDTYTFRTYLKGEPVQVQCASGVVTLKGQVSAAHLRVLAEDTAAEVYGVKAVNNQLQVVEPASRPEVQAADSWITAKAKTALLFHAKVSAAATQVSTRDGVVTLEGEAASPEQKALAGRIVQDLDGVKSVDNQLRVQAPGSPAAPRTVPEHVDDASITAQVKTSLLFNRNTHSMKTKVRTRQGIVTLQGVAHSPEEKAEAGRVAAATRGVRKVRNLLTLPLSQRTTGGEGEK